MKHFSIIIPTLNEEANIKPLLHKIEHVVFENKMEPEVIFVDDGSTDKTLQEINRYDGPLHVGYILRLEERGLASAVVRGAEEACNKIVIVMDADLSHSPETIPYLLEPLENDSFDIVIGSRYEVGGLSPGLNLSRRLGSKLASLGARLFTSAKDPLTGFFAVRQERLSSVSTTGSGFKILFELLAGGDDNLRVKEVPITFNDRLSGKSKMNFSVLRSYLLQLARLGLSRVDSQYILSVMFVGLLCTLADYSTFRLASSCGYPVATSQFLSLLLASQFGWCFSYFIIIRRRETGFLQGYWKFLITVLLGLFLRGGVLAPTIEAPISTLFLVTAFWTSFCIYIAALVIGTTKKSFSWANNWKHIGILLIGYTVLLRLVYLGNAELIQEEAYYWNYSQHMAAGYLDHPPMIALLIKFGTSLFGHNEFGVRFGTFLCWFATAFFSWQLSRILFDRETAFRSLILVACLPIFFSTGLLSTPDTALMACWAGALYFFCRALVYDNTASWYPAGIALGIGLASKYSIAFLAFAVVIYMVTNRQGRKWFLRPQPYLSALLAVLFFSPVIWWNYEHNWVSFLFQSQERIQAPSVFSTHELLGSILILITPTGFLAALACIKPMSKPVREATDERRIAYCFCLYMTLIPLVIFTLFSLTKEVKLNWTGPLWLAIIPFIAQKMIPNSHDDDRILPRFWPGTLVFFGLTYGAILHYAAIGLPFFSYGNSAVSLIGWDSMATILEKKIDKIEKKTGERPLIVGTDKYKTASGLAFYRYKELTKQDKDRAVEETTGIHLFGRNALMYSYWYSPVNATAKSIIVVSPDKNRLTPVLFAGQYMTIGEIEEIQIKKHGTNVGTYYYRILRGYEPSREMLLTESNF